MMSWQALGVAALLVALGYGGKAWYSLWWKPKKLEEELRRQGMKGNPYRFFFGDLNDAMKSLSEAKSRPMELTHQIAPRVLPFSHQTVEKYGKVCFVWGMNNPLILAGEPEMVKELLSSKFGHFSRPPVPEQMKPLGMGLASLNGEKWVHRRRIINPAFHLEKLKGMMPEFLKSCEDFIQRWEALVEEAAQKPGTSSPSCELDVWPEFKHLTADVISKTAFGSNYEEGKRILELQREQVQLFIDGLRTMIIPGFRFLPTPGNMRSRYLNREIRKEIQGVIRKKQAAMRSGESTATDLLGLLLQANEVKEHRDGTTTKNFELTVDDIIDECKAFYIAGQETTSSLLTWTVVLLAMHPDWQQQARDEVVRVLGGRAPDYESINRLKTVAMILHEVLRLYPSVTSQYRYTYKPVQLGSFTIPPGVSIHLPTLLLHHDKDLWGEDADEFNPDRFAHGVSGASRNPNAFFPFSFGPMVCIGQNFALIESKMALAMILQRFEFRLSPAYVHAPHNVITLQPQHGAQIVIHKI